MNLSKYSLSHDAVLKSLQQGTFKEIEKLSSRKRLYKSSKGILYIRTSKKFNFSHRNFWYSIKPDVVVDNNVDYIILIAGYEGFFMIPVNYFLDYRKKYHVGCVKGGGEHFSILEKNGRYFRKEAKNSEDDITQYFYQPNCIVK